MTKEVDAQNQIWFEKDGKIVRLGLTRNFLETLTECWHILPSNMKKIKQKAPLLTIESNDGLISLLSPVTGYLQNWDNKAANFPEKLTEADVIVTLTSEEAIAKPPQVQDRADTWEEGRQAALQRLRQAGIEPPAQPRTRVNPAPPRGAGVGDNTWIQRAFNTAAQQRPTQRQATGVGSVQQPVAPINWDDFRIPGANPIQAQIDDIPPEDLF